MLSTMVATMLLALWASLPFLTSVAAQLTSPSNDTNAPNAPASDGPRLILSTAQTSMSTQVNISPLTQAAGQQNSLQQLQQIQIVGRLVLTDQNTASSITDGDIAFISCDPSAYTGNNVAAQTIDVAASKGPKAIILYSTTSTYCTFSRISGHNYYYFYTTTNPNVSNALRNSLNANGPRTPQTTIMLDQSSLRNGSANALGPSPTTAVAMIILYSITGIITALFLIIIVTGAVRAHRHPERYGPRQAIGRPRQSRAKGIARAMLETLPIVKFGELDDRNKSVPHEGDVELGNHSAGNTSPATEREAQAPTAVVQQQPGEEPALEGDLVKTVTAGGIEPSQERTEDGSSTSNTDNGLTCSVCTDDFIKGQDIRLLPCKHKFHPECIDPWLLNVSGTCPLCRVDLRPTASHPDHEDVSSPNPYLVEADPITDANDTNTETNSSRRRSNGLSLYLHHTLNTRRMRDATPEERIAALRRLRTANRANQTEPEGGLAVGERTRNRVAAGFNRVFRAPPAAPPPV